MVCDDYPEAPNPKINRPYQDIVPILTAAEHLPDEPWYQPEVTICTSGCDPIFETYMVDRFVKSCSFVEQQTDYLSLSVSGDNVACG